MAKALHLFENGITVEVPENCVEGARVKITEASTVTDVWFKAEYAGADEIGDGVIYRPYKDPMKDQWVGTMFSFVRPGTTAFVAAGAITAFSTIYAAANGKVAGTGSVIIGKALNAAAENGRVDTLFNADVSAQISDQIKDIGVVNFTLEDVDVPKDGTAAVPITVYPEGAEGEFTITSGTTANVSVTSAGLLSGDGDANSTSTITVTCNGISRTCTATVKAA